MFNVVGKLRDEWNCLYELADLVEYPCEDYHLHQILLRPSSLWLLYFLTFKIHLRLIVCELGIRRHTSLSKTKEV